MDFDFSDEQEQLRDAVRKWVERAYTFERQRRISNEGGFSREAYGELADLGLCGLYVAESAGGMGMGPVEGMVVLEELGRGLVLEPLAEAFIASAVLAGYAPSALSDLWLGRIASGDAIVVLAYQERAARYHLDSCKATASRGGDAWTVSGTKSVVTVGDKADAFLVPAKAEGSSIAMFLVKREAAGVSTRGYGTLEGGRAAEVVFDNATAELVTPEGLQALEHAVDIGIAATCAQAVGAMEKTLAITFDYMNTRKQFGVAISSFQALRHRAADMKMQLELARSMSYYASLKLNAPAAERRAAMARAKFQLGNSMRFIGQQAIQLHGGIGVTDEVSISHYFKHLTQMEMTYGDTLHHLGEVSRRMQDTAGVFA
ncbi:MAG: acyl-CoA dehydrogenase family protein [Burkholderiaceae bacterium]